MCLRPAINKQSKKAGKQPTIDCPNA